jgi:hypothetical protein
MICPGISVSAANCAIWTSNSVWVAWIPPPTKKACDIPSSIQRYFGRWMNPHLSDDPQAFCASPKMRSIRRFSRKVKNFSVIWKTQTDPPPRYGRVCSCSLSSRSVQAPLHISLDNWLELRHLSLWWRLRDFLGCGIWDSADLEMNIQSMQSTLR